MVTSSNRQARLHIEFAHTVDPAQWQRLHSAGLIPDRLPYGLDRLSDHGFEVVVRPVSHSLPIRLFAGAARRATGGLDLVNALRSPERRNCELSFCWDERTGVPAALRSRLPGEPPTAMGALWMTEPRNGELPWTGRALAAGAMRNAVAVWGNSTIQLDLLERDWNVDRDRLYLVHMGIDVDFWRQQGEREPELVVGAGNDRHRDHAVLSEAMRRLKARRPGLRFELVTRRQVPMPAGLGPRHPHLDHCRMRSLYGRASVVAVATKPNWHMSGLSVLLEGMACGRAVIGTATPGMTEYIADGETGLLVQPGDPDALAAAAEALLNDPGRAAELGAAAARAVEERYSTRLLAARLAEVARASIRY